MVTKRENVPYRSLPGVVLVDVEVSRCPACGEYVVAIPAIDGLNELLAKSLIDDKRRLVGAEVKFLRKYLGYSSADFAKVMGTASATVSRWENDAQPISRHADLLLRALVMIGKKVDDYSIEKFADMATEDAPKKAGPRFGFTLVPSTKKWKAAEVRA
jgi:putative zinc finger/helix-turn-helix YgiT family protein